MEQIKSALKGLESAVMRLEEAVHVSKKNTALSKEKIAELKTVVKTAHDRMDVALAKLKQGEQ